MAFSCNIDQTDRINRACIGILIFFCGLCDMSASGFMILGGILFAQGLIGWCSIPMLRRVIKKIRTTS